MRRLLDINTWIALSIDTHPQQCRARSWHEQTLLRFLDSLYADPAVSREDEQPATRSLWLHFAQGQQSSPKVWMDAYLAAFAVSLGIELVTFDEGLKNFQRPGLRLHLL